MPDCLRQFTEKHYREDVLPGEYDNALFAECAFDKLSGLMLKNCSLYGSTFTTGSVRDALGFTLTLDCNSFRDVQYSPLLCDLLLCLITLSKGNDEKREALKDVVGRDRYEAIVRALRRTE